MSEKEKLLAILKAKGFDLAEDQIKGLVEAVFEVSEEVIKASANKFDDLLLPLLPLAKNMILKAVDKLDGKVE
jgi:hypothetical protein